MTQRVLPGALLAGAMALVATGALAATAEQQRDRKTAEIPQCTHSLGTLAVEEPQDNWWTKLQLGSPAAVIKLLVQRSRCFDLVDRGAGLAAAQRERALSGGGQLQQGSNIGGGQIQAADYVIVPDVLTQNPNSSGNNIGAALGGLLGSRFGPVGALAGSISINSQTADVLLTLTDVRTTRQLGTFEGHGKKTDIGFGVGGGVFGGSGFGTAGATGYNNTAIGQVIMLGYVDAYTQMADQMGGLVPAEGASAAAAQQMVLTNRPTRMYKEPSTSSALVLPLNVGARLYPTGNKSGLMWEVKDEKGNIGWVSSIAFDLAR
jgi:curli biogenesis system outer membrane secretion channel CsgG